MTPQYEFLLDNGNGMGQRVTHPVWKDDLSLEYAYESNQYFRRSQLSGSLVFVGSDYDYITGTAFDSAIEIEIHVSYSSGVWQILWNGEFYLTDCTVNTDDRRVTVKPQVKDKYSKLLAGMDKEFDLIKLKPAIQPVTVTRRPMIQVYVPGDSVVSCFMSGMSWEQDANQTDSLDKIFGCHFTRVGNFMEITFTGSGVPQYLTGTFIGTVRYAWGVAGEWRCFENESRMYFITYFQRDIGGVFSMVNGLRIYAESDPTTVLWEFAQSVQSPEPDIPATFTMTPQRSGLATLSGSQTTTAVYARLCIAGSTYNGSPAYEIPDDDIVPYNRNYRYCFGLGGTDLIRMSYNHSETPTEWGVRPDGDYYSLPTPEVDVQAFHPVARTTWNYASIWFIETSLTRQLEQQGRKATYLRDAFTLEAVISALLGEIDPSIRFEPSQIYSRFLYGTNPLMSGWGRLVMTPKSNVMVAEYSQPARKAPITLGKVLAMLRDVCGCYWYVNDSSQLVIEHISWFKNGGSYSGTPAIGIDLTVAENTRNGKMIDYGTNEYSYDKVEMAERYQLSWADDTTSAFLGVIDIMSGYVEKGKIEEVGVDGFNADIDYMMLNPSGVSEDGFALLCCVVTGGNYMTQIEQVLGIGEVQNWQLAATRNIAAFLISDMPAWNIKVNGLEGTAKGIQRKKQQKVNIPVGYITPNMQTLVRTGVGVGEIKDMSIRLTSRTAKTTVIYDTTQQ